MPHPDEKTFHESFEEEYDKIAEEDYLMLVENGDDLTALMPEIEDDEEYEDG